VQPPVTPPVAPKDVTPKTGPAKPEDQKPKAVPPNPGPETPKPGPDARPWRAIADGRTLDCLTMGGQGAWRIENGAICNVPGQDSAAQSAGDFGDGEMRFRFESTTADFLNFCVRQGGAGQASVELSKNPGLAGKTHELVFRCRGTDISATLDAQSLRVSVSGRPVKGRFQFNIVGGRLQVLGIDFRELPADAK
jgi:hypothetical protein